MYEPNYTDSLRADISPSYTDSLMHHGIKGMHWGIRRYQNPDGSLTPEGKKRYGYDNNKINKKVNSLRNNKGHIETYTDTRGNVIHVNGFDDSKYSKREKRKANINAIKSTRKMVVNNESDHDEYISKKGEIYVRSLLANDQHNKTKK